MKGKEHCRPIAIVELPLEMFYSKEMQIEACQAPFPSGSSEDLPKGYLPLGKFHFVLQRQGR